MKEDEDEDEEESGSLAPLFRNKYHNIQERRDKANVSLNNKKKKKKEVGWGRQTEHPADLFRQGLVAILFLAKVIKSRY